MKKVKDLIHFITTGGTIDSSWSGTLDAIVINQKSNIPDYFAKFPILSKTLFTEVCGKDSRELTGDDLKKLLQTIEESPADKIIITHGTFTLPETANFLRKNLKRHDQTIVLTGSVTSIKGFEMTDAPLNLGYAISHVQILDPGIYIAMKGRAFTLDELNQNLENGRFHEIFSNIEN